MSTFVFSDNATTTVAGPVSSGSTSITLAAGTGALFPRPTAGQLFTLTLNDLATRARYEVCYCTARVGDICTVTRGQEGTTAQSWVVGDFAYNAPTSGTMATMVQHGQMLDASIAPVFAATQVDGNLTVLGTGSFIDAGAASGLTVNGVASAAGARLALLGNGATNPNKFIQAVGGNFSIDNNAGASILGLNDAGDLFNIRSIHLPNQNAGGGIFANDFSGVLRSLILYDANNFTDVYTGQNGLRVLRWNDSALLATFDNSGDLTVVTQLNAASANVSGGATLGSLVVTGNAAVNNTFSAATLGVSGGASINGTLIAGQVNSNGNMNVGGTLTGGNVNVAGIVQGASVDSTAGNVTANGGRLRATFGARASGDLNAGVILADFAQSLGGTGWSEDPNGRIIQWGTVTAPNPVLHAAVNFPVPFPNAVFMVTGNIGSSQTTSGSPSAWCGLQPLNNSQFTITFGTPNGAGAVEAWWIAVGF